MDEGLEDAKYLLNVIRNKNEKTIAYRDLQQSTKKRFLTVEPLKGALAILMEKGYIRERVEGRKSFYDINPYFMSAENTPNYPISNKPFNEKQELPKNNKKGISPLPPVEFPSGGSGEHRNEHLNTTQPSKYMPSNEMGVTGEEFVIHDKGNIEL
ncbi:hypothetical protein BTR23_16385 [Alkalihalophilus pseudofirmus]|nr:hypothetical protein BTR23_16385 [Alkalihalophilus pseudofirmus]